MSNSKVTVGYWDCRGLAHPIILLLEFLKKPYELINPSKELVGPPPKVHTYVYNSDLSITYVSCLGHNHYFDFSMLKPNGWRPKMNY